MVEQRTESGTGNGVLRVNRGWSGAGTKGKGHVGDVEEAGALTYYYCILNGCYLCYDNTTNTGEGIEEVASWCW